MPLTLHDRTGVGRPSAAHSSLILPFSVTSWSPGTSVIVGGTAQHQVLLNYYHVYNVPQEHPSLIGVRPSQASVLQRRSSLSGVRPSGASVSQRRSASLPQRRPTLRGVRSSRERSTGEESEVGEEERERKWESFIVIASKGWTPLKDVRL